MTEKILFFSEDIAEIRGSVWQFYYREELKDMIPRGHELMEKLDKIYNQLYCGTGQGKQVVLEDEDRRGYSTTE